VPYATHRVPEYWNHPDAFDPDHFLPEQEKARPKGAYLPFSLGQRMCIGAGFAMLELQLLLPMIVGRFRLRTVASAPVQPEPVFTLRPRGGLLLDLERLG
jgi:cytochrome P450